VHILEPIVNETWTGTGTGSFTSLVTRAGYVALDTHANTGDYVLYHARNADVPGEYEEGIGEFTEPDGLSRVQILRSSNAGAAVNFSAGTKQIAVVVPAAHMKALLFQGHPHVSTDFHDTGATQTPFIGAAISSGTNTTAPAAGVIDKDHPGVVLMRSSTTANSGYRYATGANYLRLGGGERFDLVFRTAAAFTNTTFRAGFHESTSSAAPVDGAFVEFVGSGVLSGKTRNNSTESVTGTTITLSANTWYHLRVTLNDDATLATFEVFDMNGDSLWSATLSTNIPTASGRETAAAAVATNSGTTATDLIHLDYMSLRFFSRQLIRGRLA
jgi:hypothetical protein